MYIYIYTHIHIYIYTYIYIHNQPIYQQNYPSDSKRLCLKKDRDRHDAVALEDLPRLLPDMKFDKFEVEVGEAMGISMGNQW